MSKKKRKLQPDLGYSDAEGKLRDDGLHDAILASKAGDKASREAAKAAAIKRGLSKAAATRIYG